jgi:hypothetical protein
MCGNLFITQSPGQAISIKIEMLGVNRKKKSTGKKDVSIIRP